MPRIEVARYVATVPDESRSIVLMLGQNGGRGPIAVNDGPSFSARVDRRRYWHARAAVLRGSNIIVGGVQLSLVTLTGCQGSSWLYELYTDHQGTGRFGVSYPGLLFTEYGLGVLAQLGSLVAGDVLELGAIYD